MPQTTTTTTTTTEDKKEKVAEEEKKEETVEKDKKEEITEDKKKEISAEQKTTIFPALVNMFSVYKKHIFGTCTGIILIAFIMHYYKHTPLTCIWKMTLIEKIGESLWKWAGV